MNSHRLMCKEFGSVVFSKGTPNRNSTEPSRRFTSSSRSSSPCWINGSTSRVSCSLGSRFSTMLNADRNACSAGISAKASVLRRARTCRCERNSETKLAQALRRPGFEIQRLIGTREPDERQLEVGRAALAEILRAEAAYN